MGNCMFLNKKIRRINKNGIVYYEMPSYSNKNIQEIFTSLSSAYPNYKIISINDNEDISDKSVNKCIYIHYDITTQMVTNVSYFP